MRWLLGALLLALSVSTLHAQPESPCAEIATARVTMREARASHEEWLAYYARDPHGAWSHAQIVGDPSFHATIIDRYRNVERVLVRYAGEQRCEAGG